MCTFLCVCLFASSSATTTYISIILHFPNAKSGKFNLCFPFLATFTMNYVRIGMHLVQALAANVLASLEDDVASTISCCMLHIEILHIISFHSFTRSLFYVTHFTTKCSRRLCEGFTRDACKSRVCCFR